METTLEQSDLACEELKNTVSLVETESVDGSQDYKYVLSPLDHQTLVNQSSQSPSLHEDSAYYSIQSPTAHEGSLCQSLHSSGDAENVVCQDIQPTRHNEDPVCQIQSPTVHEELLERQAVPSYQSNQSSAKHGDSACQVFQLPALHKGSVCQNIQPPATYEGSNACSYQRILSPSPEVHKDPVYHSIQTLSVYEDIKEVQEDPSFHRNLSPTRNDDPPCQVTQSPEACKNSEGQNIQSEVLNDNYTCQISIQSPVVSDSICQSIQLQAVGDEEVCQNIQSTDESNGSTVPNIQSSTSCDDLVCRSIQSPVMTDVVAGNIHSPAYGTPLYQSCQSSVPSDHNGNAPSADICIGSVDTKADSNQNAQPREAHVALAYNCVDSPVTSYPRNQTILEVPVYTSMQFPISSCPVTQSQDLHEPADYQSRHLSGSGQFSSYDNDQYSDRNKGFYQSLPPQIMNNQYPPEPAASPYCRVQQEGLHSFSFQSDAHQTVTSRPTPYPWTDNTVTAYQVISQPEFPAYQSTQLQSTGLESCVYQGPQIDRLPTYPKDSSQIQLVPTSMSSQGLFPYQNVGYGASSAAYYPAIQSQCMQRSASCQSVYSGMNDRNAMHTGYPQGSWYGTSLPQSVPAASPMCAVKSRTNFQYMHMQMNPGLTGESSVLSNNAAAPGGVQGGARYGPQVYPSSYPQMDFTHSPVSYPNSNSQTKAGFDCQECCEGEEEEIDSQQTYLDKHDEFCNTPLTAEEEEQEDEIDFLPCKFSYTSSSVQNSTVSDSAYSAADQMVSVQTGVDSTSGHNGGTSIVPVSETVCKPSKIPDTEVQSVRTFATKVSFHSCSDIYAQCHTGSSDFPSTKQKIEGFAGVSHGPLVNRSLSKVLTGNLYSSNSDPCLYLAPSTDRPDTDGSTNVDFSYRASDSNILSESAQEQKLGKEDVHREIDEDFDRPEAEKPGNDEDMSSGAEKGCSISCSETVKAVGKNIDKKLALSVSDKKMEEAGISSPHVACSEPKIQETSATDKNKSEETVDSRNEVKNQEEGTEAREFDESESLMPETVETTAESLDLSAGSDTEVDMEINYTLRSVQSDSNCANLSISCSSPEDDFRGISPYFMCLSHLSPGSTYGKDSAIGVPRLAIRKNQPMNRSALSTPVPFLSGEEEYSNQSFSSLPPTSQEPGNTSQSLQIQHTPLIYADGDGVRKGCKRKAEETAPCDDTVHPDGAAASDPCSQDYHQPQQLDYDFVNQFYQSLGKPPDVSTWTAVNTQSSVLKRGNSTLNSYSQQPTFSDSCVGQGGILAQPYTSTFDTGLLNTDQVRRETSSRYASNFQQCQSGYLPDPSRFGAQQCNSNFWNGGMNTLSNYQNQRSFAQQSVSASVPVKPLWTNQSSYYQNPYSMYSAQQYQSPVTYLAESTVSKPTCAVPPFNQGMDQTPLSGTGKTGAARPHTCTTTTYCHPSAVFTTSHKHPSPAEFYNFNINRNNIDLRQSDLSGTGCSQRLYSSSEAQMKYPSCYTQMCLPTSSSTLSHSHTAGSEVRTRPATATVTCEGQMGQEQIDVSKPDLGSGMMEGHEKIDNVVDVSTDSIENEATEKTAKAEVDNRVDINDDTVIPLMARNTKMLCRVGDMSKKSLKAMIDEAERKKENEPTSKSKCSAQTEAQNDGQQQQKVSPAVMKSLMEQRKTKSPFSALCAVLDLSKKKEKLVRSCVAQPSIPVSSIINKVGPTLTHNGQSWVPFSVDHVPKLPIPRLNRSLDPRKKIVRPQRIAQSTERPRSTLTGFSVYNPLLPQPTVASLPYANAAFALNHSQLAGARPLYTYIPGDPGHAIQTQMPAFQHATPLYSSTQMPYVDQSKGAGAVYVGLSAVSNQTNIQIMGSYMCQMQPSESLSQPAATCAGQADRDSDTESVSSNTTSHDLGGRTSTSGSTHQTSPVDQSESSTEKADNQLIFHPVLDMDSCQPQTESLASAPAKRSFKARHYNFCNLTIGTFRYSSVILSYERTARVKFIFSKKKIVYEFQLNDLKDVSTSDCKKMAEIEIPFSSICSLWLFSKEMRIEVTAPPKMFLGARDFDKQAKFGMHSATSYDRERVVDLTGGQMESSPFHHILFKSACTEKIRRELRQYDGNFAVMLRTPFRYDPEKTLKPSKSTSAFTCMLDPLYQPSSSLKVSSSQMVTRSLAAKQKHFGDAVVDSSHCSCPSGCQSVECCCYRDKTTCMPTCSCSHCKNPLNILQQCEVPLQLAKQDPCLMENIYQIKKLELYLNIQLRLECCHREVRLRSCIPDVIACPYKCNVRYRYSWCSASLCNETLAPRNHCIKCRRCTGPAYTHCQACNLCYFAGEQGTFKCPECRHGNGVASPDGDDLSSDTDY